LWIIVDDGSTDDSLSLATRLASHHDWIRVVKRDVHTSERNWLGYGAVVSFGIQIGVQICMNSTMTPALVAVLDADTVVEADYFERLASGLAGNPKAVIASGMIREVFDSGGRSRELPTGCARVYKKVFLDEIAGFPEAPSPDTVLDIKATRRNYEVFVDVGAKGRTHASTISRDASGFRYLGRSRYYLGLDVLSMLLTTLLLSVANGVRMGHGFFDAYMGEMRSKSPRIDDFEIREHFSCSWRRLFLSRESVASIRSLLKSRLAAHE
jgi:glycosyltransferase involved in cell wall biosynthesis